MSSLSLKSFLAQMCMDYASGTRSRVLGFCGETDSFMGTAFSLLDFPCAELSYIWQKQLESVSLPLFKEKKTIKGNLERKDAEGLPTFHHY